MHQPERVGFSDEGDKQTEQVRCQRNRRLLAFTTLATARSSVQPIESFQTTVRADGDPLEGGDFYPGQSERPALQRCESFGAGKSCQGSPQLVAYQHRRVRVRLRLGLA